jgi:hypothetical protein
VMTLLLAALNELQTEMGKRINGGDVPSE